MTQFRKKPVVIEAKQWFNHGDHPMVERYDPEKGGGYIKGPGPYGWVKTLEGGHIVSPGDWIIKGVKGEFYPCKPEIFAATYESSTTALPVIDPGPDSLEREIQAKADNGPRVTPFEVEAHIRSEFYFTAEQGVLGESELGTRPASWTNLDQVTICVLILTNGTKIVGVNEGPVSRENFKADLGRQYARQKAVDQIWPLLGFRLRDELARPVLTHADAAADLAGAPRPDNPTAEAADFLASVKACDLSGDAPCEACQ